MYDIKIDGEIIKVKAGGRYLTHQSAINGICEDGCPYASMTVCIKGIKLSKGETILDTNNLPNILEQMSEAGLVEDTGRRAASGFCVYPIVKILKKDLIS